MNDQVIVVAAMYKFVDLPDYESLQQPLLDLCKKNGIKGTLLLAKEGINGTVAGSREGIDALKAYLLSDERFHGLSYKESSARERAPFLRMRVRLKKEIVTLGQPNVNAHNAGTYVKPEDWNALISDPDVVVVDTRNEYEIAIGTFKGAVNPNTTSFREFPQWVADKKETGELLYDPETGRKKKVAMFCTGGIRCEKSTAFMKAQGFDDVYHLEGGILKYLEKVPQEESMWEGECFVFDERISVKHGLEQGSYVQCHACRHPLSDEDVKSPKYVKGESCPHCWGKHTPEQMERFRERQHQMELAQKRDQEHLGADMDSIIREKRAEKIAAKDRLRELNKAAD